MTLLPFCPAHRLAERLPEQRWLIEDLFAEEAVGIVGGEPKCCKSFLALDMAVAVASGTRCLRRFAVARPGTVLLYAAEDAAHVVRARLQGICAAAGVALPALDVQVITSRTLRLDVEEDRTRLADTVAALRPRLLVLDPFVRLHRVDENASGEVAPLLAFLRDLQRACGTCVALVHHSKKGAGHARAGQALRGSSEFHAWGDSNLYLRRDGDRLVLAAEHRAARALGGLDLRLEEAGAAMALAVVTAPATPAASSTAGSPADAILARLRDTSDPVPYEVLREACGVRHATFWTSLRALTQAGRVRKTEGGYLLASL